MVEIAKMEATRHRRKGRVELGAAAAAVVLAVVTAAWPEWIEALFGVEPDGGSGTAEWGIVFCLLLVAVLLGTLGRTELRRAAGAKTRAERPL